MDPVYSVCIQYGSNFWYILVLLGDSILLFNFGLRFNDFNFYVMGEKYVLSLLSAILVLCNPVKLVRLQVILSCSEQNIFSLVDKCFNIFQYLCQD